MSWIQLKKLQGELSEIKVSANQKSVEYEKFMKLEQKLERMKEKLGEWVKLAGDKKPKETKRWGWW